MPYVTGAFASTASFPRHPFAQDLSHDDTHQTTAPLLPLSSSFPPLFSLSLPRNVGAYASRGRGAQKEEEAERPRSREGGRQRRGSGNPSRRAPHDLCLLHQCARGAAANGSTHCLALRPLSRTPRHRRARAAPQASLSRNHLLAGRERGRAGQRGTWTSSPGTPMPRTPKASHTRTSSSGSACPSRSRKPPATADRTAQAHSAQSARRKRGKHAIRHGLMITQMSWERYTGRCDSLAALFSLPSAHSGHAHAESTLAPHRTHRTLP